MFTMNGSHCTTFDFCRLYFPISRKCLINRNEDLRQNVNRLYIKGGKGPGNTDKYTKRGGVGGNGWISLPCGDLRIGVLHFSWHLCPLYGRGAGA